MNNLISDYELIMRFIKGEQSCFEQLIHRHKNKVFAYISLYIRDEALAEDIFQDTFLKVIQSVKAGKYADNGKFISWEPQGYAAMEWMEKNGNPEYPNCHLLDGAFGIDEPYETDEVKPDTVNEGMME